MKKHFKKRLAAFKVGLVLSIMITPFCFYKLAAPVSALTNVITTNNYGSFERINETFSVGGVVGFSASSVRGNLNGVYNGTLRIYITISGSATISDFSVVPENCFIQYYSSSYIDIAFNGVTQWEVTFISTTYNAHAYITIDSLTNWNMSYRGQSSDELFIGLKTTVEGFTQYIDNLEQYTGAINRSIIRCENLLTTIANNGTGGGSQVITNIDTNVDLAVDDLNLLKTSNDSILSTLLRFLTDSLGQVITLDTLLTAIDSAVTELQNVNTQLTTLQTSIDNILLAIQNIDTQIDTISWNQHDYQFTWTRDFNSYNNAVGNQLLNYSNNSVYILTDLNINNSFNLIKLKLPYNITSATIPVDDIKVSVYGKNGNTLRDIAGGDYYIKKNGYYIEIYLYNYDFYPKSSGTQIYIYLSTSNKNITLYEYYTSGSIAVLDSNDIEYWTLIQYFNQYTMNNRLLKALQNLSININGDIVNQTESVINNYDTDFTTINNIESNFTTNFDNTNPSVISLFNSNLQIPQGFIDGSTFVKTLFPKVVDNNGLVGFPYFLILAIVVLIVILG